MLSPTYLYIAWAILILAIPILIYCIVRHKHIQVVLVLAIFLAGLVLYFPVSSLDPKLGHMTPVYHFATAFYRSLELFVINGNPSDIYDVLSSANSPSELANAYQNTFIALFVAAPIATATVILSYFKGVTAYLRLYTVGLFTKLYVFSELNERSIALAKDIAHQREFHTILFHDVYPKDEERFANLMDEAQSIDALCFACDLLKIKTWLFRRKIEYFLISSNESENMDHAIRLTHKYQKRPNTNVYVWAQGPESGAILDSLPMNEVYLQKEHHFKLRRINPIELFVWNTLTEADLCAPEKRVDWEGKQLISILIVGMGDYGTAFLKTAVWMYQMPGVRLEINVVDQTGTAKAKIQHQCPELLDKNDCELPGESHYSIRFIENTDIFQGEFDALLLGQLPQQAELSARLQRTTAVFVTLGNDDANIRATLDLRTLFDRVYYPTQLKKAVQNKDISPKDVGLMLGKAAQTSAFPEIYTPVYDSLKTENLEQTQWDSGIPGLCCYDNVPYFIQFKGNLQQQYSYASIAREALEKAALEHHLFWSSHENMARDKFKYEHFEYFRHSSMARALHETNTLRHFESVLSEEEQKIAEHMRWNAYMRAEGYRTSDSDLSRRVKLPRAKIHYELVSYSLLTTAEQNKDATNPDAAKGKELHEIRR